MGRLLSTIEGQVRPVQVMVSVQINEGIGRAKACRQDNAFAIIVLPRYYPSLGDMTIDLLTTEGIIMVKKIDLQNIVEFRRGLGMNQSSFWSQFGVTQSGGSRYESGRSLPRPVAMLVWLKFKGRIKDKDLADALKGIK